MSVLERLNAAGAPSSLVERASRDGEATFSVDPSEAHALLSTLKAACGFETVSFLTAVDRSPAADRFEVTWMLRSERHCDRVRVTTRVPEGAARVRSVTDLWPGAAFMERECYDMFGIDFEGHEDLKRLLMPEGYGHHPLRKEFPHHGIEPDRLYREWERSR
jgi:NADH-quinone oxidoreductase subunit C